MSFLRKNFLWILLITSVAFAGYIYSEKKAPCKVPIQYTVGSFDTRFNISQVDFLKAASDATHIWENAYGKDLFEYAGAYQKPNRFEHYFTRTPVVLNLVYDSRQVNADANRILVSEIDETKQTADEVKAQFKSLQAKYNTARAEYLSLLDAYKKRQGDFNALEVKRQEVNSLADDINTLVKKYNYLVGQVNSTVQVFNKNAGQEFEEGQYKSDEMGEKINIYEFGDRATLTRVLAHEFGHALGLEHNENPTSIMYYLNSNKNIKPTAEDIAGVRAVCGKK